LERCRPRASASAKDDQHPWDASIFLQHFPELEFAYQTSRQKLAERCCQALSALLFVQHDFPGVMRCLIVVLRQIQSMCRRMVGGTQTTIETGRRRSDLQAEFFDLVGLFELLSEALPESLGPGPANQLRLIFYKDLRDQFGPKPSSDYMQEIRHSLEANIIRAMSAAGMAELARERWQDRIEAMELGSACRELLWMKLRFRTDLPRADRAAMAMEAARMTIARGQLPRMADVRAMVRLCWHDRRPWHAASVLLALADSFRASLALQRLCARLLLELRLRAARGLVDAEDPKSRPNPKLRNHAQRLHTWAGRWLDTQVPWFFRAGAALPELRQLLPRRAPHPRLEAMEVSSGECAAIGVRAQLEACACCIERRPLHCEAWCFLGQVLCDLHVIQSDTLVAAVREVWAPPRCILWARLFYGSPTPPLLRAASGCVLRGLVLLFVHFPNGTGHELGKLAKRVAPLEGAASASASVPPPEEEVPLGVARARLRRAVEGRGAGGANVPAEVERLFDEG